MEINRKIEENSEKELRVETVLVLQGGGSLGAYECGVYKTLAKHNIQFDIVSGTSIGALNAAIIASYSYDSVKNSTKQLENFWLELAETLIPLPSQFSSLYFTDESRAIFASMYF
jgi:NTE family protein